MTRFARANGSKADNRKNPEKATPWSEMQKQLLEKTSNAENEKLRKKAEAQRQANFNAFLEEKKATDSKKTVWAQFPGVSKAKQKITDKKKLKKKAAEFIKQKKGKGKKEQKQEDEDAAAEQDEINGSASDDEIDTEEVANFNGTNGNESMESDDEIKLNNSNASESDDEETTGRISKEPGSLLKIKKTEKRKNSSSLSEDEEMPEEASSKIPEPIIKIKKKKQRKPSLKISATASTNSDDATETAKEIKSKKSKKNQEVGKSPNSNEPLSEEKQQMILEKKKERRRKQKEKLKLKKQVAKQALQENGSGEVQEKSSTNNELAASNVGKKDKKKKQEQGNKNNKNETFNKKPKKEERIHTDRPQKREFTQFINGKEVKLAYFDGFPVKQEDAVRLKQLKNEMISKGLPMSEINRSMKLERRRAEKALTRERKKVCFKCRQSGHELSECPELGKEQLTESTLTGVCFKCGSTEHAHYQCKVVKEQKFKYATCFVCKEQGHIASQCKENDRGLYPKGGACKECGDVRHYKKDCPQYQAKKSKEEESVAVDTIGNDNPDDEEFVSEKKKTSPLFTKKGPKVIRYFK